LWVCNMKRILDMKENRQVRLIVISTLRRSQHEMHFIATNSMLDSLQ
jgi:hypothetical protein